jgi:hypothetical protein
MHTVDLACVQSPSSAWHITCHGLRVAGLLYDFNFLQRWWWQSRVPPFVMLPFAFNCFADHRMLLWEGGVHCKLFWLFFEHLPDCKTEDNILLGRGDLIVCKIWYFVSAVHTHTNSLWISVAAATNWPAWYFQFHLDRCVHIFVCAWYYT